MVRSKTLGTKISDALIIIVLVGATLLSILPIINMIAISLSSGYKASAGIITFYPQDVTLESYKKLLQDSKFFLAFWVSIKRVFLSASIGFILNILLAYPLSKDPRQFKFRNIYMWFFVFTMMFSGGLVPWFLNIKNLGLIDKIWALVLPGAVSVYNVILIMNFFRSLPKELDECAGIDGAGPWRKLFIINLPLSLPVLATVTLFTIVWNWNSFFDGLVLMNKTQNYPLQTYVQQLVVTVDPNRVSSERIAEMQALSNRTLNAAKLVITMIPILVIYPFLQRYFVTGITLGSVKE